MFEHQEINSSAEMQGLVAPVVDEVTPAVAADAHDVATTAIGTPQDAATVASPTVEREPVEGLVETDPEKAANEKRLRQALQATLEENVEDFTKSVESCDQLEMVLLMEALAQTEVNRTNIRKVGALKKRFDAVSQNFLKDLKERFQDDDQARAQHKEQHAMCSRRFNAALAKFNKRKYDFEEQELAQKKENSVKKRGLLDQLKEIVQKEEVTAIDKIRQIQEQWRAIGNVLPEDTESFFHTYRMYLDQFYSMRDKYNELVDQDRKHNLHEKQQIILEILSLLPTDDDARAKKAEFWQEAGERVRLLQEKWMGIGPAPRAVSDDIWKRFKEATDDFFARRRAFYEVLDKSRAENAEKKQALLKEIEAFENFTSEVIEDWRKASDEVRIIDTKWREVGPAPRELNKQLNDRFKQILDTFREKRSHYFQELDESKEDMIKKKESLLNQAEELKDSSSWQSTAEMMKQLQREWLATGPDNYKDARKFRKRFRKACDHFFNRYKESFQETRQRESVNLKLKEEILEKIDALTNAADAKERISEIQKLREEFNAIGRCAPRDEEKIQGRFLKAYNNFIEKVVQDPEQLEKLLLETRASGIKAQSAGLVKIQNEERKCINNIRGIEEKIMQYENNILFISAGKGGDSLRKEIEAQIHSARELKTKYEQRLKVLQEMKKSAVPPKEAK